MLPVQMLLMILCLRVVVGRLGILVHVQAGEAAHALSKPLVVRFGESQEHEAAHAFAGVEPVRLRDELLVVRAVFGELGQRGAEFLVLLKWPSRAFLKVWRTESEPPRACSSVQL